MKGQSIYFDVCDIFLTLTFVFNQLMYYVTGCWLLTKGYVLGIYGGTGRDRLTQMDDFRTA